MATPRSLTLLLSSLLAAAIAGGCNNPVVDAQIAALGPEVDGVPPSDIHRPGQPCVLCHGPYKGAKPEMAVGGTIYAYPYDLGYEDGNPIAAEGVEVEISDSLGNSPPQKPVTNCAGNFYVKKDDWSPAYPLHVAVRFKVSEGDTDRVPMDTRISRDGSCAGCHESAPNQGSPGWIYCVELESGIVFDEPESCSPSPSN
jgi:hypothetical protein